MCHINLLFKVKKVKMTLYLWKTVLLIKYKNYKNNYKLQILLLNSSRMKKVNYKLRLIHKRSKMNNKHRIYARKILLVKI